MAGYVSGGDPAALEEDHLTPLELGGAAADPPNLWPEPRIAAEGWNAGRKDGSGRVLHRMVCDGRLPLALSQRAIALDWRAAYRQFVHSR